MLKKLAAVLFFFIPSMAISVFYEDDPETERLLRYQLSHMDLEGRLSSVEATEIHAYWTTGVKRPDTLNDVIIGGATFGNRFFTHVRSFLNVLPKSVSFKLVLDAPSYDSNGMVLRAIGELFPTRFNIAFIGEVVERLKRNFPSGKQRQTLETIFKNAETGNPAIASDVYRTVGLWWGHHEDDEIPVKMQLAYTDIDTFVFNMQEAKSASSKTPLYLRVLLDPQCQGHGKGSNDVIKTLLTPENLGTYKKQTEDAFKTFSKLTRDKEQVFNYYPKLHEFAQRYYEAKGEENQHAIFEEYQSYVRGNVVTNRDIIETTGPGLHRIFFPNEVFPIEYESAFASSWSGRAEFTRFTRNPIASLFPELSTDESTYNQFLQTVEATVSNFRSHVENAYYVKRLGENHPLFLAIRRHIEGHILYQEEAFKNYTVYYFYLSKILRNLKESHKEWSIKIFKKIVRNAENNSTDPEDLSYYTVLQRVLKDFGIYYTLTQIHIEDLFTQPPGPDLAEALRKLNIAENAENVQE